MNSLFATSCSVSCFCFQLTLWECLNVIRSTEKALLQSSSVENSYQTVCSYVFPGRRIESGKFSCNKNIQMHHTLHTLSIIHTHIHTLKGNMYNLLTDKSNRLPIIFSNENMYLLYDSNLPTCINSLCMSKLHGAFNYTA